MRHPVHLAVAELLEIAADVRHALIGNVGSGLGGVVVADVDGVAFDPAAVNLEHVVFQNGCIVVERSIEDRRFGDRLESGRNLDAASLRKLAIRAFRPVSLARTTGCDQAGSEQEGTYNGPAGAQAHGLFAWKMAETGGETARVIRGSRTSNSRPYQFTILPTMMSRTAALPQAVRIMVYFMDSKKDKAKSKPEAEIVVFSVTSETKCTECDAELWKGSLLRLEGEKALCMGCADLDRLEFLPSGDAAVTRRAGKYSMLCAVVVRWSRARKRYERQGILVEPEALRACGTGIARGRGSTGPATGASRRAP